MTTPIIWLDELAFIKYCNYMFGAMRPAFATARDFAKAQGSPYGMLVTTTPSSLDQENGMFTYNLIQGAAQWDEKVYDWFFQNGSEYVAKFVEENSTNNFIYIEYSYKQLGRDEAWFKNMIRELNNDMSLVKREILLEWTYSSSDSLFDEETLDMISRYSNKIDKDEYTKIILKDNYIMYVIRKPSNIYKKNWIVSIDIAGGLGRDRTAITVIDPLNELPTMILYSNSMPVSDLIDVVTELKTIYLPNAIIVPERNYSGDLFIELLQKNPIFNNSIFYTLKSRKMEKSIEDPKKMMHSSTNTRTKKEVRVYGIHTNTTTRDLMINEILFDLVRNNPGHFNNPYLFNELKTLVRKKTGKIEHQDGAHDDILMSYLIGLYAYRYENKTTNRLIKVIEDDNSLSHEEGRLIESSNISTHNYNTGVARRGRFLEDLASDDRFGNEGSKDVINSFNATKRETSSSEKARKMEAIMNMINSK